MDKFLRLQAANEQLKSKMDRVKSRIERAAEPNKTMWANALKDHMMAISLQHTDMSCRTMDMFDDSIKQREEVVHLSVQLRHALNTVNIWKRRFEEKEEECQHLDRQLKVKHGSAVANNEYLRGEIAKLKSRIENFETISGYVLDDYE